MGLLGESGEKGHLQEMERKKKTGTLSGKGLFGAADGSWPGKFLSTRKASGAHAQSRCIGHGQLQRRDHPVGREDGQRQLLSGQCLRNLQGRRGFSRHILEGGRLKLERLRGHRLSTGEVWAPRLLTSSSLLPGGSSFG